MRSHETDSALRTAWIFNDHIATAWNIGEVLDSKRSSVVARIRTQSFKHDLRGAVLFRHVFRRIIRKLRRLVDECSEDRLEAIMVQHNVHHFCSLLIVKNRAVPRKTGDCNTREQRRPGGRRAEILKEAYIGLTVRCRSDVFLNQFSVGFCALSTTSISTGPFDDSKISPESMG